MLSILTAMLLRQLAPAGPPTPNVSEARAKAIVGLGFASGSLAFDAKVAAFLCSPEANQTQACERAEGDVQAAKRRVQEATGLELKPEAMNGCERVLLAAAAHYSQDRLLAAGIASAQGFSAPLSSALAKGRTQLQLEAGPDPKLLAACRAVPGSWFAATWDGVVKAD